MTGMIVVWPVMAVLAVIVTKVVIKENKIGKTGYIAIVGGHLVGCVIGLVLLTLGLNAFGVPLESALNTYVGLPAYIVTYAISLVIAKVV